MATSKSPFYVIENFLSPKQCEIIVDGLGFYSPDVDADDEPIKMSRHHDQFEQFVYEKFKPFIPDLEKYYNFEHRGTETIMFEFFAEGTKSNSICENSNWIRKKWVKTKDRDFSIVLFLSDYQNKIPFDSDYEVYGGKLEFPQHNFGFNPQRGTLIVFPSGPHFINAYSEIIAGDLFLAKFHLAASVPYLYDPSKFPGNYEIWFSGYY